MRLGLNTNHLSPIAVDFGTDQLKLLQVEFDQDGLPRVVAAGGKVVPHDIRQHTAKRREFLTQSVAELVKAAGFKGRRAIASIPSSLTFVQHVKLAGGDGIPVEQKLAEELAGKLPVDPSCCVIRHVDVGPVGGKQEMICMAAGRQAVLHHIDILKAARLRAVGMHGEPTAILRAFDHLFRRAGDEKRTTLFVDVGYRTSKAMVAHGPKLVFAKLIQVAGEHLDRHFADELGIELEEARQRRRRQADQELSGSTLKQPRRQTMRTDGGGTATDAPMATPKPHGRAPSSGPIRPGEPGHEMIPAGGEMLECLVDELQLCVGYHASMFAHRRIDSVVFLGGEANQRAMCRRIAQALKLPAQLGDPLCRVGRSRTAKPPHGVDLRKPQPGWAVPLGLCQLPANL